MASADSDRRILRDLAKRVAEIADAPVMALRRRRRIEPNSLRSTYPMMLVFPEGSWCELLPDTSLQCTDERTRAIEFELHRRIYGFEHFQDDTVLEKNWAVPKTITSTGWGLETGWIPSPEARGEKARLPEEPGAVIPHTGICAGGGRATALSIAMVANIVLDA